MTDLGEKILLIVLPSIVEAENFSDHPHTAINHFLMVKLPLSTAGCCTTCAQTVPLSTVSHFITCAQPNNCLLLVPAFVIHFSLAEVYHKR
jgi:hypothetical protein